jgi:hypothetical protein
MGLLPAVIAFAVVSLACLLVVVYAMAQRESLGKAFVGLVTVLYAFVWGWQNADEVELRGVSLRAVMTVWSWFGGAAIVFLAIMGDKT